MAQTKTQKILRYALYIFVGAAILGVVGYALIIRPLQIRQQKQNFDKAEASLDTLAAQIQQTIGKADQTKKEKSCDRANLLTEKGPLGCDVSFYLLYEDKNASQSTDLMKHTSSIVSTSPLDLLGKPVNAFVPKDVRGGDQTVDQDAINVAGLSCGVQYIYPVTTKLGQPFKPQVPENLEIVISCSGPAMKEFFPLKD